MKILLISITVMFLEACSIVPSEKYDVGFMFYEERIQHSTNPVEDDSKNIIKSLIEYSEVNSIELMGISKFIWGRHPTVYILFFEDHAIVNFFYWGKNVGKGRIDYDSGSEEIMSTTYEAWQLCEPLKPAEYSIWGFHVTRGEGDKWKICNEPFFFFEEENNGESDLEEWQSIHEYFNKHYGSKIVWSYYTYGKD